ncbi:hypothetical protein [Streptomyces sp. NPDC001975]
MTSKTNPNGYTVHAFNAAGDVLGLDGPQSAGKAREGVDGQTAGQSLFIETGHRLEGNGLPVRDRIRWYVVTDHKARRHTCHGRPEGVEPGTLGALVRYLEFSPAEWVALAMLEHATEGSPFCGSCEDTGTVTLYDGSTDGVIGSRACEDKACIQRGRARARITEQRHTGELFIGHEVFTPHICSECHYGGYTPVPGLYPSTGPVYVCTAWECGHTVDRSAFEVADGERLAEANNRLHTARARRHDEPPF